MRATQTHAQSGPRRKVTLDIAIAAAVLAAMCALALGPGFATAGTSSADQKRIAALEKSNSELRAERDRFRSQATRFKSERDTLQRSVVRYQTQTDTLRKSLATFRTQLSQARRDANRQRSLATRYRSQAAGNKRQADRYRKRADDLAAQRRELASDLSRTRKQLAQALAGLPKAIDAVPLDRFLPLVLLPAAKRWPCDETSTRGSSFTITFKDRSQC